MSGFYARVAAFKREMILAALCRHKGNQLAAADDLGLHRNTLRDYCDKLGIDPSVFYPDRAQPIQRPRYFRKGVH